MHPGRCAAVELDGQVIGHLGELHPRWRQAYELLQAPVLFELELDTVMERSLPEARSISRQPSAWRDLALVVPEHATHDALIAALRADEHGLVQAATLFDVYKPAQPTAEVGPGERSLAVRIELLDRDATLTEDRIDVAVAAAVQRAAVAVSARLRG